MNRRLPVFGAIAAVIIGIVALFAFTDIGPDGSRWDDDHQTVQTITRSDGTVDTVIIERDGPRGFFPLFPILVIVGIVLFVRFAFGPRRDWSGPGGCGGPGGAGEDRLREWHRREHERMGTGQTTGA